MPMPWGHIAAKAWGSPNNERVLVIHGILDNAGAFDRLLELLPRNYYFVCIDLPGHGLSSHLPAGIPLDYFNYILSIRRVLDHLKWKSCVIIGHSLGANVGLMFSAIYPQRVTKILCIDAVFSIPIPNDLLVAQVRRVQKNALSIKTEGNEVKLYTEDEVMYMLMNLRGTALNIAAAKALMKRSVTKVGDKYKLNRDPRLNAGLLPLLNYDQHLTISKEIEIPITVILASGTRSRPINDDLLKLLADLASNPKNRVLSVEGNHDVHNNYPERLAPHVCQFLGSIKSSL